MDAPYSVPNVALYTNCIRYYDIRIEPKMTYMHQPLEKKSTFVNVGDL